jgi:hypothetical protein
VNENTTPTRVAGSVASVGAADRVAADVVAATASLATTGAGRWAATSAAISRADSTRIACPKSCEFRARAAASSSEDANTIERALFDADI